MTTLLGLTVHSVSTRAPNDYSKSNMFLAPREAQTAQQTVRQAGGNLPFFLLERITGPGSPANLVTGLYRRKYRRLDLLLVPTSTPQGSLLEVLSYFMVPRILARHSYPESGQTAQFRTGTSAPLRITSSDLT